MADNSARAIEIFTEAIRLPIEEQSAFLDRACAEDKELRQKIEALLRTHDRVGGFLEQPAATIGEGRVKAATVEKPGDRVDRYKLLQQIGEGGCGVVFLAEQQSPVVRRVALKVVKPGMDTKSVIARFEAERQALALMDHPNIAHVFDAGATETGRPYFVMELVEGVKITDYCDRHSLPIGARLELFDQVCDAIQHAHQKGIIHRDIKPSNILVTTAPDGKPVPKVIDFGIAKATTGQQLTDKTIFTAREMLIGTPAYMSPEQAALTSADVDTRTDIYSLGVLLYELLTGTTPFDARELLKAGLDEVRRVIREEEPVRPSTRLSTMIGAELENVSKHHGAETPKLVREMRGDLDWIVMKALEKDRARRYATANGLAMDIKRYLSGEAILARPPSRPYKIRKLILRHKLGFAAFGIVMATLIAGLSITAWSLSNEKLARGEANQQRKKAEIGEQNAQTELARSQEVTELMKHMFAGVNPITALGRDTKFLQEILDQTVARMGLELTNQPAVRAELKLMIGGVYGSLGEWDKEEPLIRKALDFYQKSPEGNEKKLSDAFGEQALLHLWQGRLPEAEQAIRKAIAIETNLPGKPTMRLVVLETHLAWIVAKRERAVEAEEIFRRALAAGQRLVGDESEQLLDTRAGLATALSIQGKFAEAERRFRESLTLGSKKLGTDHPYVANDMYRLARVLELEHEYHEAEELNRQCVAIRRKMLGREHPLFDEALTALGRVQFAEEKRLDAADAYLELLGIRRKRFGDNDSRVADTVAALAVLLIGSHDQVRFDQFVGDFPRAWLQISDQLASHGRWTDAMEAATKFLEIQPDDSEGYHLAAPLLVQTGDRAAYELLCEKITARFAGATNAYTAGRMARDCLILARPGADLKVPGDLAETAVTLGREDSVSLPYFQCCKALAEFRQEHYKEAVNWAQFASQRASPHARAEAAAITAMAQVKLSQLDEARRALSGCDKVIEEKLPKLETGDIGRDWRDWIIAHALQSEARRMIDGDRSSTAPAANQLP